MAYQYGPPPPAPPPAPPTNAPSGYAPQYGQSYQQPPQRGGHGSRGRGAPDRAGYHQPPSAYAYTQHAPQYAQPNPAPYPGPHAPTQGAYPPPQQQQQQPPLPQQWHPEHGQQHPQQPAPHTSLAAGNYHPNYAPQLYQQQQPQQYGGQPAYPTAPQPQYPQGYPAPVPQPGPPAQQWGGHPQPPLSQPQYGGGGRGRGYNDRGGAKGQMMGPPLRIGFDGNNPQAGPAPVSNAYQPQVYGAPQAPPTSYPPAPYQGYPAPAPYMAAPAPHDGYSTNGPRHNNRGAFGSKPRGAGQFGGGDKMRNRNPRGPSVQTPPTHHQKPDAASAGKKKKRKTNTLGLTPGDESEEDDENEEEKLNEMYGAEAPNPVDSSEIAAWIAQRRANFPTKGKIEAKNAAAKTQNGDGNKSGADRNAILERQQQKAEKLRKQLEKVESSIKRKREQQDEGDEMRNFDAISSASSDTKSDDDDEKPEVMSTRQEPGSVPPPARKADPTRHCKYFSTGGTCGKRGKCRFVHDQTVREAALKEREMNGGRMTLQQRLILNDKEQEDLTIVQVLQYLQEKGLLKKDMTSGPSIGAAASNAQPDKKPASQSSLPPAPAKKEPGNGLPPIPPPSVVSHGPAPKYTGWNLSGFGNTGVRPNEG
ncbi:hypothetical protein B0T22DRAFT_437079 [Podospora appendiculata]|uniref:C3H1-type domain-containing protein n=1 Tax=Podospora appendiculata TaxID=314037 RepID=A0AAE1CGX6_9PEZI|nr:hypothetical protein B0T22DRAFT_437079 [Podospora appendiculata]